LTTTLLARPKINLGLKITGRRPDGYHELDSFFYPLEEPHDRIAIHTRPEQGLEVICHNCHIPRENNSLVRSYQAMEEKGLELPGLVLELHKGIPMGAGLGGGSCDAACLLNFLNAALPVPLSPTQLADIALSVGADVPFFLRQKPARVQGLGEKISPCEAAFLPCWLVLVTPAVHIDTGWAYGDYDRLVANGDIAPQALTKKSFASRLFLLLSEDDGGQQLRKVAWNLDNDLELPVMRAHPFLAALKQELWDGGASAVAMSGSGSSLYALFPPEEEELARLCAEKLSAQGLPVFRQWLGRR